MTEPLPSDAPAPPEGSLRNVRIWSPLAVAVYGLLLGYPASLILAVKNWRALGLRDRILPHVVGAALLTFPLVGIMILSAPRVGRIFSLAMNVMAFVYLKEKLRSDLRELAAAQPDLRIETRRWYSALGWALLGTFMLIVIVVMTALIVAVLEALIEGVTS